MKNISVRNVNQALVEAIWWLKTAGVMEESRNGPVLAAPGPVCTTYTAPTERVLFDPLRDANPVFHLVEGMWMLSGRNNVADLEVYNSNMRNYAEKDGAIHGAYGFRWREHFENDQLFKLVRLLEKHPDTRQAVLQMWDADVDLGASKKDIPCNTHVYFDMRGGVLNMTVCCRSNDMVWGAYGANVVHFSMLQEWIASALKFQVGVYRQFSNNFHAYVNNEVTAKLLANPGPRDVLAAPVMPMLAKDEVAWEFLDDCDTLFRDLSDGAVFNTRFATMVGNLARAYRRRKQGEKWQHWYDAADWCDWKAAFNQWVARRDHATQGELK